MGDGHVTFKYVAIISREETEIDWPRSGSRTFQTWFEPEPDLRFRVQVRAQAEPEPLMEVWVQPVPEPEPPI